MTISSQAGLGSIRRSNRPQWANRPTIVITLNSAAFELRLSADGHWYVIHAQPGYPTAQGMIGLGFEPGRNPWEWESGYAARIQQQLNTFTAEPGQVTEAFGRPITPQFPITEVPHG